MPMSKISHLARGPGESKPDIKGEQRVFKCLAQSSCVPHDKGKLRLPLQWPPGASVSHWTDEQRDRQGQVAGLSHKGGRRGTLAQAGCLPLPVRQLLMSLASSMPSGQAQVNLGEWGLICGAGRHRYWQPPLRRVVLSHQFTPEVEEAGS